MEKNFINCKQFSVAFSVPNTLVDIYLDNLTLLQIKIFLYILRHSDEGKSYFDISRDLKVEVVEIEETIEFLKNIGLLKKNSAQSEKAKTLAQNSIYETTLKYKKPDPVFVAKRINKSKEISFLVKEAQIILGRPISNLDASALIMFHDTDGLPIDVILMLLQYAVSIRKSNMKYIEKIAVSWAQEGIDSIEKAENKIKRLQKEKNSWQTIRNLLQLGDRAPTAKENECFSRWLQDYKLPLDLIKEAYDRCVNIKGRYMVNYIDAILKNWEMKGITDLSKLNNYRSSSKKHQVQYKKESASAYNISEYLSTMDKFA